MSGPSESDQITELAGRRAADAIHVIDDVIEREQSRVLNTIFDLFDTGDEISYELSLRSWATLYAFKRVRSKLVLMKDRGVKASERNATHRVVS